MAMNKKQQSNNDNESLVTVFKTNNPAIVAIVKSILDGTKIKYLSEGAMSYRFGCVFQVMPEDAEYAKELLKDVTED